MTKPKKIRPQKCRLLTRAGVCLKPAGHDDEHAFTHHPREVHQQRQDGEGIMSELPAPLSDSQIEDIRGMLVSFPPHIAAPLFIATVDRLRAAQPSSEQIHRVAERIVRTIITRGNLRAAAQASDLLKDGTLERILTAEFIKGEK